MKSNRFKSLYGIRDPEGNSLYQVISEMLVLSNIEHFTPQKNAILAKESHNLCVGFSVILFHQSFR